MIASLFLQPLGVAYNGRFALYLPGPFPRSLCVMTGSRNCDEPHEGDPLEPRHLPRVVCCPVSPHQADPYSASPFVVFGLFH